MLKLDLTEFTTPPPVDAIRSRWEDDFFESRKAVARVLAQDVAQQVITHFVAHTENGFTALTDKNCPFMHCYRIAPDSICEVLEKAQIPHSLYREWAEKFDETQSLDLPYFSHLLGLLTKKVGQYASRLISDASRLQNLHYKLQISKVYESFHLKTILWIEVRKLSGVSKLITRAEWNKHFEKNMVKTAEQIGIALTNRIIENLKARNKDPYQPHPCESYTWSIPLDFRSTLSEIAKCIPKENRLPPFKEWIQKRKIENEVTIDSPFFTDKFTLLFKKVERWFALHGIDCIQIETKLDSSFQLTYRLKNH